MGKSSNPSSSASSNVKSVLKVLKKDKVTQVSEAVESMNAELLPKSFQSSAMKDAKGIIEFLNNIPKEQSLQVFKNAVNSMGVEALKERREILKGERQKEKRSFGSSEQKAEAVANKMLVVIGKLDTEIEEVKKMKTAVLMNFLKHYYNFSMKGERCDNSVLDSLMEAKLREFGKPDSTNELDKLAEMMGRTHL